MARHHHVGTGLFGLWLNAIGQNADLLERHLLELGIPVARTATVALNDLPALLAAADAHLITLRPSFPASFPLQSPCLHSLRKANHFRGPKSSDVHLLCTQTQQLYFHVTPGDVAAFAQALQQLESSSAYVSEPHI